MSMMFRCTLSRAGDIHAERDQFTVPFYVESRLIGIFHQLIELKCITCIAQRQPIHRFYDVSRLKTGCVKRRAVRTGCYPVARDTPSVANRGDRDNASQRLRGVIQLLTV